MNTSSMFTPMICNKFTIGAIMRHKASRQVEPGNICAYNQLVPRFNSRLMAMFVCAFLNKLNYLLVCSV